MKTIKYELKRVSPCHWAAFNIPLSIAAGIICSIYIASCESSYVNIITISIFVIPTVSVLGYVLALFQAALVNVIIKRSRKGPIFELQETDEEISG